MGDLTYGRERLEDDSELKLHSLSNQKLWALFLGLKMFEVCTMSVIQQIQPLVL